MDNRQFISALQALQKPDAIAVLINGEEVHAQDIDFDPVTNKVNITPGSFVFKSQTTIADETQEAQFTDPEHNPSLDEKTDVIANPDGSETGVIVEPDNTVPIPSTGLPLNLNL